MQLGQHGTAQEISQAGDYRVWPCRGFDRLTRGDAHMVRILVKELGADLNRAQQDGGWEGVV